MMCCSCTIRLSLHNTCHRTSAVVDACAVRSSLSRARSRRPSLPERKTWHQPSPSLVRTTPWRRCQKPRNHMRAVAFKPIATDISKVEIWQIRTVSIAYPDRTYPSNACRKPRSENNILAARPSSLKSTIVA